ncbi:hypothetical protein QVD17_16006 [Tagetes erecta]|uniref:Uncharacterized protein n=1 Tax=Tagetes erecta TaxID=13708 RepID=A0AAD8NZ75_TARER|nr:hypothetical protein QVD17_16006 [Tagetes erecta]
MRDLGQSGDSLKGLFFVSFKYVCKSYIIQEHSNPLVALGYAADLLLYQPLQPRVPGRIRGWISSFCDQTPVPLSGILIKAL